MFKSLHVFRVSIAWFLLATFCLHLTGCYSKEMIPLDKIQDVGKDKIIVIRHGEKAGILKNPRITSTHVEGELYNPFTLDKTFNPHSPLKNRMPTETDQIKLYLSDDQHTGLLFKASDTVSICRIFFIPRESIKDTGLVYTIRPVPTVLFTAGLLLLFITPIVVGVTWQIQHFGSDWTRPQ